MEDHIPFYILIILSNFIIFSTLNKDKNSELGFEDSWIHLLVEGGGTAAIYMGAILWLARAYHIFFNISAFSPEFQF